MTTKSLFKITDLLSNEQIELLQYFLDPDHERKEDDYQISPP